MKAVLFDYGAGNMHSIGRALAAVGLSVEVEADPLACVQRDELLVLPGVGAFGLAADRLDAGRELLRNQLAAGRPCLGVCLGMQLLFPSSEEGRGDGLGLIAGEVVKLAGRRVPHIGWTAVEGLTEMYFAHSYICRPTDPSVVRAWATHDSERFPAIIRVHRTAGVQFHPEKSSAAGMALLARLVKEVTS